MLGLLSKITKNKKMFKSLLITLIVISLIFNFGINLNTEAIDDDLVFAAPENTTTKITPTKRTIKTCPNGGYTFGELSSCPKAKTVTTQPKATNLTNNLKTTPKPVSPFSKTLTSSKTNTKGKMIRCSNKGYFDRDGKGCPTKIPTDSTLANPTTRINCSLAINKTKCATQKNLSSSKSAATNCSLAINKSKSICQCSKSSILPVISTTPKSTTLPTGITSNPTGVNAPIRESSSTVVKPIVGTTNAASNTNIPNPKKSNIIKTTNGNINCQKPTRNIGDKLTSNTPTAKIVPKNIGDQCKLGTTRSTLSNNLNKPTNQLKSDTGNYGLFDGITIGGLGSSKIANTSGVDNFFKIKNCKVGSTSSSITEPQIRGDTIKPKPQTEVSTPSQSGSGDYAFASIMDKISTTYNRQCGKYFDSSRIIGKAGYGWQTTNSLRGNGTGCCYGAVWAGLLMNKAANPSSPFARAFGVIDTVTANYGTPANDFHRAMQSNVNGKKAYQAAGLRYSNNPKTAPIGSIAVHSTITPGYGDINVKVGENKWVNYATMGFMEKETSGSHLHIYSPI